MTTIPPTPTFQEDVARACQCMLRGGVILYPTDTIWGIGCDATCSEAVRRVFELKRRAESKALITLVDSPQMLRQYVDSLPDAALEQMSLSDRPLTMVLDGAHGLAPEVLAADGSAGFRITREGYSQALCCILGRPVVSTSANLSGGPSAALYGQISNTIVEGCDYVAHYRRDDTSTALPSRVIKISPDGLITILRP